MNHPEMEWELARMDPATFGPRGWGTPCRLCGHSAGGHGCGIPHRCTLVLYEQRSTLHKQRRKKACNCPGFVPIPKAQEVVDELSRIVSELEL